MSCIRHRHYQSRPTSINEWVFFLVRSFVRSFPISMFRMNLKVIHIFAFGYYALPSIIITIISASSKWEIDDKTVRCSVVSHKHIRFWLIATNHDIEFILLAFFFSPAVIIRIGHTQVHTAHRPSTVLMQAFLFIDVRFIIILSGDDRMTVTTVTMSLFQFWHC